MSTASTQSTAAATDVGELLSDLDGGQFERMLSVALSQSAAASVDNQKVSEVNVKFTINPIGGTHQVHMHHTLVFKKPTSSGKVSEETTHTTTLHVGKFGKLSLTPENQGQLFDRGGQVAKA